jgi:retron-type reverse transcriptase
LNKLEKTINNLKNKASADELLSVNMLKDIFDVVGYPLLNIINTSLETGVVPSELKSSVIIPIPKIANPKKPEELRPINLLPAIEKVLEIIVHEQLVNYLEDNGILFVGQSGFRSKHSCESACQFLLSKWKKQIDEGNIIVSVFVDLKRAFETINRNKLIDICKVYGVGGTVLNWLENYLNDRYQTTKVANTMSQKIKINYGVPQGSVLGPLLFILYINDIDKYICNSFINLYVVLSVSGTNFEQVVDIINNELNVLNNWLKFKSLKLNATKTKCMILGTRHKCKLFKESNFEIRIDSVCIDQVEEVGYLGVQLDP